MHVLEFCIQYPAISQQLSRLIPRFLSCRYIMENKNSEASKTRDKLKNEMEMLDLLNNNIVIPYSVIEKCSVYPETLYVTESRQYRERGLWHITDSTHEFFLLLEQERVDHINLQMFSLLKVDMVDESI